MKPRSALAVVVAVVLSCFAQAKANTINITVDAAGALLNGSGVASNTQYESLNGGQNNNNPGANLSFLNGVINNWNGVPKSPPMGPAQLAGFAEATGFSGNAGGTFGFTGVSGSYDYVVMHFGNGPAGGSPGGWYQAFYIGGENLATLTFTVPTVNNQNVGGVSSARFFDYNGVTVPDGGMTLILLGVALSGLALSRRFVKA
jgi:hypothetical protein